MISRRAAQVAADTSSSPSVDVEQPAVGAHHSVSSPNATSSSSDASPSSSSSSASASSSASPAESLYRQILVFTLIPVLLVLCLTAAIARDDHTAVPKDSLTYITSLARASEERAAAAVRIPHILHVLWLEAEQDPFGERQAAMDSWSDSFLVENPHWSVIIWTEDELRGLRMQNRKVYELYDIPATAKRDIAAIEVLHKFGGVVVDVSCFWGGGSVDQLLADAVEHSFFATRLTHAAAAHPIVSEALGYTAMDSLLANWMVGASPMHPIVVQAAALLPSMVSKIRKRMKTRKLAQGRVDQVGRDWKSVRCLRGVCLCCVCVCTRACVCTCVRACVCACLYLSFALRISQSLRSLYGIKVLCVVVSDLFDLFAHPPAFQPSHSRTTPLSMRLLSSSFPLFLLTP